MIDPGSKLQVTIRPATTPVQSGMNSVTAAEAAGKATGVLTVKSSMRSFRATISRLVPSVLTVALCPALLAIPLALSAQTVQTDGRTAQTIIRYDARHHPVIARQGMVVSQNDLASRIGAEVLARGGNAVDAAVATGFALAVTLPRAGNLGGSGFMLVHLADSGQTIALDNRT